MVAGTGTWRDRRTWVLVAITVGVLAVGWLLKEPCIDAEWTGFQFEQHCYSDVQALHRTRGAGDGTLPYVETFNEYPVLTGLFMHAVGGMTDDKRSYVAVSAVLLGLFAALTTLLLADLLGPTRKVLYWAAAPAVALYYFYNWDILAVAGAVAGVWAYRKDRMALAGIFLALGACAKLWPAFMLPALGLAILRQDGGLRRRGWAFGLGAVGTLLALNVPFAILNLDGFLETYRFHMDRGANFESVWYAVAHLGREWSMPWMDALGREPWVEVVSTVPFLAALAFSCWAAWTRRLDPVAAAAIPVLAFLAFNKVFSVQYTLWALPLVLLTERSPLQKAAVVAGDLAVFVTLFAFFAIQPITSHAALFFPVAMSVLLRAAALAWCMASLVRLALRARPGSAPPTAPPSTATPSPPLAPTPPAPRAGLPPRTRAP
jgi:uncharacterized membrane protein